MKAGMFLGKMYNLACFHSFPGIHSKPLCFALVGGFLASEIFCVCQQCQSHKLHLGTDKAYNHLKNMVCPLLLPPTTCTRLKSQHLVTEQGDLLYIWLVERLS